MTELELRNLVVQTARGWLGCKESDGSHRKIIDEYNSHKPLARGYRLGYTDPWCAGFVSAVAIRCGLTGIIPTECSCSKQITLLKDMGAWVEEDGYVPQPGDLCFYDWDDSGKGDCTGAPDHVGIVTACDGKTITVIEGNYDNAVKERTLTVDGRYIRGYGVPDYASMATPAPQFEDVPEDAWYAGDVAYCAEHGLVIGDGDGKFRPDEPNTRAETAALLARLARMLSK